MGACLAPCCHVRGVAPYRPPTDRRNVLISPCVSPHAHPAFESLHMERNLQSAIRGLVVDFVRLPPVLPQRMRRRGGRLLQLSCRTHRAPPISSNIEPTTVSFLPSTPPTHIIVFQIATRRSEGLVAWMARAGRARGGAGKHPPWNMGCDALTRRRAVWSLLRSVGESQYPGVVLVGRCIIPKAPRRDTSLTVGSNLSMVESGSVGRFGRSIRFDRSNVCALGKMKTSEGRPERQ